MALHFLGKDPDSRDDECAAVAIDTDTGDLILNAAGASESDIAALRAHTAIGDHERTIHVPARMRPLLAEALRDGSAVQ